MSSHKPPSADPRDDHAHPSAKRPGETRSTAATHTGESKLARVARLYRTLGPFLKPYWKAAAFAAAALVITALVELLKPWPLKIIFDHVLLRKSLPREAGWLTGILPSDTGTLIIVLCVGIVAIVALFSLFGFINRYFLSFIGQGVTNDIRIGLFQHLQSISLMEQSQKRTGDLVLRLTSDIKTLSKLLVDFSQKIAQQSFTFLVTLAVMLWMDWQLTLIGLAVVPVLFALSFAFAMRVQAAVRRKRSQESEVASMVQETVTSLKVVQAFNQEKNEKQRFEEESRESLAAGLRSDRLGRAFSRLVLILNACGLALVVGFGARRVLNGHITPGDLIVFAAYVDNLYRPIEKLSELVVEFFESLVSGERILEILHVRPTIKDAPGAVAAPRFRGQVEFRDVVFGYEKDKPVIRGLNFRVEPGQVVALVGSSGTGKSTVVNLLLRFFDPQQGQVSIDGTDIRKLKIKSLRQQISIVPQEPILFKRSIRENIAYGNPQAGEKEIVEAARAAQAHEFIEKMPRGYDTELDERGGNLSGGQRQRLALARAILKDAPILVLDEPSTGLDASTEEDLMRALEKLTEGRTTFVIAHNLATIQDADLILVMEEGKVVEQGHHRELLKKSALYRELWETQQRDGAPVHDEKQHDAESSRDADRDSARARRSTQSQPPPGGPAPEKKPARA